MREARVGGLRVAVVHSFYGSGSPSGENQAVEAQMQALGRAGHSPRLVAARTDELGRAPLYPLRAAVTVTSGRGRSPLAELRRLRPDVVHVHNLFPNFGRTWLSHWSGAVVVTVHNYRPLCAAGTLYREGAACTRCPDGDRWAGLRHGCYRGSRMATAPLAWAGRRGAGANPLLDRADRVVVLSDTSRQMYLRTGIARHKLVLIPNFTTDLATAPQQPAGTGLERDARWVFAGRLSPEKGLLELLRLWPADQPLDVVGDGPLLEDCRRAAPQAVRFLGTLDHTELRRRLPSWHALVFPSRWLEGAPLIYPEALAAGLPVLAFAGSAVANAVRLHGTGTVIGWDDPLDAALSDAAERFPGLRRHCRNVFERHYTEQQWTARIEDVYAAVIAARQGSGTGQDSTQLRGQETR
ncbi:glycosyltransferase family 4 protein [Actinacidiphila oryziradicis]|uniref:glycosyltransferase family 4 protein n=1 Tax=Actinacidiphila oryziradicis TaxID=2571141 RepID=UPI001FE7B7FA|nr:glycosyltransferase family 4 protein [Actinacidiphila oryziradicis]